MSATREPKIWFTLLEGKQHGPHSFTALVQGAKSGHLDPEDGVCRLGWEAWRLARDVPGLFKKEEESVTFHQEQDADSMEEEEEDTKDHERSHSWPTEKRGVCQEQDADSMEEEDTRDRERFDKTEKRRKSDDRAAARKAAADAFMTSKPLAADRVLYKTFTGEATVSADERPAFGASAGWPESLSKRPPEQKNRSKDAWIVTLSVLAVVLAVVGAGWAATSLGIIRVTLLF